MDIANLLINVKSQQANQQLAGLDKNMKNLGKTAGKVGKTFLAGWTFTKVLQGIKMCGDAFTNQIRVLNLFNKNFIETNDAVAASLQNLQKEFALTNLQAKELVGTVGAKLRFFDMSEGDYIKYSDQLAQLSENIAAFYGMGEKGSMQVADSLTRSLYGMTRGLRQFGINVDTTTDEFKRLVRETQINLGLTEEQAKAQLIANELVKQGQQYNGAAATSQESISKQLENIK